MDAKRIPLILVFALIFAPARALAQDPPRFTIDAPSLTRAGCTLIALAEDGSLQVQDSGELKTFPRCVEIRQDGRKLPPLLTRNFVSLTNGDRLPLEPDAAATLEDGRLRVWPAKSLPGLDAKGLSLFVPNVVLLFWSIPDGIDDPERFIAKLQDEPRKRDAVYLKNGDRLEGTLAGLDGKIGCTVAIAGRNVQTPWSKVAGIAFNTDRQAKLRTKKTFARATLEGGARVNLLDLRFEEKTRHWVGKTQFGASLELPEANLLALDVRQGPAVDLAELTPKRYEHRPYLGAAWPLVKDAAATGQTLRLAGNSYEHGLGTHAACQVVYQLDAKYERFDAIVGINESSRRGRAKVAIDLDGKRIDLNEGKELTHETAPVLVRLDVKGIRVMTLIVELGSFGDVQANVNWAKARLIKKEPGAAKGTDF